ncbi:MAG TPA: chromosome segregation protein SMC [Terriglobales bacterium]|nr:chromosome segregation protein SMC [Terriglobales bacterium]
MLKLKKLQILGFKSFCDRTELKFHGEGVAGIIGPNGCGKSNISDAITWVLGEQSAKSLRGARMEDVIFAGTRDRKPMGMAEVSLTLIDPDAYDGGNVVEPEIEVVDDLPQEDWDEATLRTKSEQDADEYIEEVRPGQVEEVEGAVPQQADAAQTAAEPGTPSAEAGTAEVDAEPKSEAAQTAPTGVVLKIRRRKFHRNNFKKGEIVVTRRLFRSGESEYLLNGKLCRLRDIQEIFMGTGLGPESYAIIEQGRIGQILSSKPTDRRAIIEEAAGITKFKTKKRLAEARLEEAKLNLSRLNDIFDEVTRQMNSLKRQAAKAERYAKLRDEMRAKLRVVLASKWVALQGDRASLEEELTKLSEEIKIQTEAVQVLEAEHTERTQRGYDIESEATTTRERLATITRDSDRAQSRQKTNEERCVELATRMETADRDIAAAIDRKGQLEQEVEASRQTLATAASDVAAAQQDAAARQQEAREAASALQQVEREQEQRRVQVMQAVANESAVRNEIAKATEQIAGHDREAARLHAEVASANSQIEAFGGQRGQLGMEFESASERVNSLTSQIQSTRETLEQKRREEVECKRHLDGLRAEYATALGRKASLEAVINEHGYSTDSVRRLFQSGALDGSRAPVGVLADFLEVEGQYEHVVDDFLRDELNFVVVKSWDAADYGMNLLRGDVDGRATFLVHPSDAQAKFSFSVDESAHAAAAARHDTIVPLKNCIRVLDGFGKSLEVILPKLGNGYIVPDPNVARELALENPDAFFLAKNGESFHNVTVTGGKQRAEGPLAMKRELRVIAKQVEDLEMALREQERRAGLLAKEIAELTSLLERLEADKREADKQAMTSGHMLRQLDSEMERTRQRLSQYERELQQVATARSAREQFIAEKQTDLSAKEQQRTEIEQQIAAAQENLATLRAARDTAAQNASEMMAKVAGLEERRRSAAATLQRVESIITEVSTRLESLKAQAESASAEKSHREAENVQIAEQLVALAGEREGLDARVTELQTESESVRSRLTQIEEELKASRSTLDQIRDRRGEVSALAAKLESDATHMSESSVAELGVIPTELLADESLQIVTGENLTLEDETVKEMKAKLEAMGPVNMMALDEYKETSERHTFLETQRKDLFDSIENTQKTIKEIEQISKEKFTEAFAKINENFQVTFRKLFGGGQGFMKLTDEENAMESGIDVVASPPGKKLQNVLLLSGGEKALTAFSLLVGIFQYTPSPFCILDEVDAPLDEANIGRFTELVKEMSSDTQFIIITHSKKTMGIAPVLYGVTMQEPGVSKLVSVRFHHLEETKAMSA